LSIAIVGAAAAAIAVLAASTMMSLGLIAAGILGLIALFLIRAHPQGALLGLAFGRATLEGTGLLALTNVGGLALGPGDILTLAFFGGVMWHLAIRARRGTLTYLWQAPTLLPVALFLGMAGFSLLYSPESTQGARDILKFASAYSVFLLLAADRPDPKTLRRLLMGITLGAVIPITVGLGQLVFGGAKINAFQGWARIQSVFIDPNTYGFYLVTVVAAAWALRGQVSGRTRLGLDAISLAAFGSVFLTLSRNAVAALGLLVIVIGLRQKRFLILAAILTVAVLLASPQVFSRGTQIVTDQSPRAGEEGRSDEGVERSSLTGRIHIWDNALDLWRERPVLGIGFGATSFTVGQNAHNDYIRSLTETGLIGFLCFISVMVSLILLGRRAGLRRMDAPRALMGLSLGYVLVSAVSNNLGKNVFQFHFWLFAGICYVWSKTVAPPREAYAPFGGLTAPVGQEGSRGNGAIPLLVRVQLNDGRAVEGLVGPNGAPDDDLLMLTRVTRTFGPDMKETVTSPLDAVIARDRVVRVEVVEDSPPAAAPGHRVLDAERETSSPQGDLVVRLTLVDERRVDVLARFNSDGLLVPTKVVRTFDALMNEVEQVPLKAVLSNENVVEVEVIREEKRQDEPLSNPAPTMARSAADLEGREPAPTANATTVKTGAGPAFQTTGNVPRFSGRDQGRRGTGGKVFFTTMLVIAVAVTAYLAWPLLREDNDARRESASSSSRSGSAEVAGDEGLGGTNELAFVGDASGVPQVYVLETLEGQPERLAPSSTVQQRPDFSPDGKRIVYSAMVKGQSDIFISSRDEASPIRVTDYPSIEYAPDFSPDGQSITFVSNLLGDFDIFILDLSSEDLRLVTHNKARDSTPAWSPDGNRIAFATRIDGDDEIHVATVDGSAPDLKVTDNSVADHSPEWSPDGTSLVFNRIVENDSEIFLLRPGVAARQLTFNKVEDRQAIWSPDGRGVFFGRQTPGGRELLFKLIEAGSQSFVLGAVEGAYGATVR
jgi:O-antigen ligase